METLSIQKEAAVKAHENAKTSGKKLLEDLFGKKTFQKDVMERVKTFGDVLKELDIHTGHFENSLIGLSDDEQAYRKAKLIVQALNEGWTPDWTDSSQGKYYPWFNMDDSSAPSGFSCDDCVIWHSVTDVGSRLCFKSSKLAQYAGEQFIDIYRELFILK
jgi:hypothetical protein